MKICLARNIFWVFLVLGIKPKALHMLYLWAIHPQPLARDSLKYPDSLSENSLEGGGAQELYQKIIFRECITHAHTLSLSLFLPSAPPFLQVLVLPNQQSWSLRDKGSFRVGSAWEKTGKGRAHWKGTMCTKDCPGHTGALSMEGRKTVFDSFQSARPEHPWSGCILEFRSKEINSWYLSSF
jgi:hypothetical protein